MSLQELNKRTTSNSDESVQEGPFLPALLLKKVVLHITEIGNNLQMNLHRKLAFMCEGKCIEEGIMRPGSIKVIQYTAGQVHTDRLIFHVTFQCSVCRPVEGMHLNCVIRTITKAGIHADVVDPETKIVPITVFVARDYKPQTLHPQFNTAREGHTITVIVYGVTYEIHDQCISVLAAFTDV